MPERKAHKQRLIHRLLAIRHRLQSVLLIVHLLVFGHIGLVREVVEVARVGLGVELWDEWCALGAQLVPVYFGEVLVRVDVFDGGEALGFGGDEAGFVSG